MDVSVEGGVSRGETPAITIRDLVVDGPGGLLGMALDPGLLKGTGNDYVYAAYTYADRNPATGARRTKIVRFTYDSGARTLGRRRAAWAGHRLAAPAARLSSGRVQRRGRNVKGRSRRADQRCYRVFKSCALLS